MIKYISITMLLAATISLLSFSSSDNDNNNQPVELGKVNWMRDFDAGLSKSKKENKPVFLLFQEVPGCATCRNYGHDVLSHPLIVDAIETLFVPVAVYNNKGGEDAKILKMFAEPAWNNPVVRIVNNEKKNLIKRVSGNYSKLGIVDAMIQALVIQGDDVPSYLQLLKEELEAEQTGVETATFSMYCFWSGEKKLADVNGVLETQAGWMNGREVVEVKYNPYKVSFDNLVEEAKDAQCASHVFTENKNQTSTAAKIVGKNKTSPATKFRLDKEPKYYLSKSIYQYIPMTQLQAAKVNSKIGSGQSPDALLSPKQLTLLSFIKKNKNKKWKSAINVELMKAWEVVDKLQRA